MTRRFLALAAWLALIASPVVSVIRLSSSKISSSDWQLFVHHGIITSHLVQFVSICVVLIAWGLTIITLIQGIRIRQTKWCATDSSSLLSICGVALAGFLSFGSSGSTSTSENHVSGIEIQTVISPVMAGVAAAHAVRRMQSSPHIEVQQEVQSSTHLLDSSEDTTRNGVAVVVDRLPADKEWQVVVRLYGYPRVENRDGASIDFRKRKALELLSWLSINRDRPLRSAARTAMWESNISDSSFATVVSDMRRGLSDLCPHISPREWAPPTFTDEIVLSDAITTDVELLRSAWKRFEIDRRELFGLVTELSRIRDVPFAGTNYDWPDVDGSTTRFVILGANIARECAYWSYENKEWDAVTIAVTAGLRLLPGDEELLDLQRLVLQSSQRGLD
jgi:hypothetical protein